MSADEDTELRDLVAQALESNGVLGKIKAQLRASVFLALEEQESLNNKTPLQNPELRNYLGTKEGKVATSLIREFLEFYNLEFTISVFDPESNSGESYEGRTKLAQDLNLTDNQSSRPLLAELIQQSSGERGRGYTGEAAFFANSTSTSKKTTDASEATKASGKSTDSGNPTLERVDSKEDGDSFFDDHLPSNTYSKSITSDKPSDNRSSRPSGIPKPGSSLPAASTNGPDTKKVDFEQDVQTIDKNLADMGFDVPEDDYDDDFDSSNVSPMGPTPRSARSDHNIKSIEEDIQEEMDDDDLSVAEDLLKSDNSGMDDLTTDRTVSPTEQSNVFDYAEDVHLP